MAESGRPEPPPARGTPKLLPVAAGRWWRVHVFDPDSRRFRPEAFNDSGLGNARFSPLFVGTDVVPTLYAAATLDAALMETVLHDVPYPSEGHQHDLERDLQGPLHASRIEIVDTLNLVDLTKIGLQRMQIQPSELFETNADDYPRTRRWADFLRSTRPSAQGLQWMSARQPEQKAIVLFGDRIAASSVRPVPGTTIPLRDPRVLATLLSLLDRLGCAVPPDR